MTADLIVAQNPTVAEIAELVQDLKPIGSLFVHYDLEDITAGWRRALVCIDQLGLILRAEIILWGGMEVLG